MDILGEIARQWAGLLVALPEPLKTYLIRIGVGLGLTAWLALLWVRVAQPAFEGENLRKALVVFVGISFTLLLPANWIVAVPDWFQAMLLTITLFLAVCMPYALAANLIRTHGRQVLARRMIFGMIAFGMLLQLAISGNP